MLFYFTATGNSLYVAKQLDTNIKSIPQIIDSDDLNFTDRSIGIVCPVFGHEVPLMVREFLEKAKFTTDYFYMILTYGKRHGGASELAVEMLKNIGLKADYINVLLMVDNFLPVFDMNEEMALDKNIEGQIEIIKKDINSRRRYISPVTDEDRATHLQYLSMINGDPADMWRNIYTITDECVGCGICTKVCPANCWHMVNKKPTYSENNCQSCMACIHACPQKAIKLKMPEKNPDARFRNEHISLTEIIESNNRQS